MNQTHSVKLAVTSMAACLVLAACSSGAEKDASDRITKADATIAEEGGGGLVTRVDPSATATSSEDPEEGVPAPGPLDPSASADSSETPRAGVPTPIPAPRPRGQDCPAESICFYESADFSGRKLVVGAHPNIPDLRSFSVGGLQFNDQISSVINNSTSFIELWTESSYAGIKRDVPDFSKIANLGAGLGDGNINDRISSVRTKGVAGN